MASEQEAISKLVTDLEDIYDAYKGDPERLHHQLDTTLLDYFDMRDQEKFITVREIYDRERLWYA